LTFRFAVFPGGTQPQPQFIFLAIVSPPFPAYTDKAAPEMFLHPHLLSGCMLSRLRP
jgi:hypothetical protein